MSARILIVDDTPLNVKLMTAKLARDYYFVSTASNGKEALKKVAEEKPDLILLDVMMPEMDGFETCLRLKRNPATAYIPVIIVTALSDIEDRVKGLAAGADDFLTKPINDIALMARIRSLLRMKVLMDEWRSREATALQLSPEVAEALSGPLNIRNCAVTVIDDTGSDGDVIRNTLAPLAAKVSIAKNIKQAEAHLTKAPGDLVYVKLDLSDEDGLQICPFLRSELATRHLPIVMIASPDDMEKIAKGLDLGANDYILRPLDKNELFARTRTQLRHKRNYDRLRSGLERNLMLALVDPLTGAFNRRYLDAHFPRFIKNSRERKKPLSVQMIDIDLFKKVNDTYGHAAGDAILKEVAMRLSTGIRPSDFFVRWGGEEFLIVMPDTELHNAEKIAERIRHRIEAEPIFIPAEPKGVKITISIGVASTSPHEEKTPAGVFNRADAALLCAKQAGRNTVSVNRTK
ncbi:MAG: PleD family two-component system response regulator [Alphaproteobacteria bacterium]|nr:PleD family two-component system response regulator [Alphaproteobacteria bacterium]